MHATELCLALVTLAPLARAQAVEVTAHHRAYDLWASGYDYEFDDGIWVQRETHELLAPWNRDEEVVLDDYYGVEVSRASATHDSAWTSEGLTVSMHSRARSDHAPYFQTDAGSVQRLEVDFDVRRRVRYRLLLDVETDPDEYSVVTAWMNGPEGSHFGMQVWGGDTEVHEESGWLRVGSYALELQLDAGILLTHGESAICDTFTELDLSLFQAADFDLDGDVDALDRLRFRQAFTASSAGADVDGDGDTDARDWRIYLHLWLSATTRQIGF